MEESEQKVGKTRKSKGKELKEELDDWMDEIDEVLDKNAEEFVKSYVQGGGQGESGLLDPSFFVGAATASLLAGITWDVFKGLAGRVLRALRGVPGPSMEPRATMEDGSLDPAFEYVLEEAWLTARDLIAKGPIRHTRDEARALHWTLFFLELQRTHRLIQLPPEMYQKIRKIAAATPERLHPSQFVARIVDKWLKENPMV
ncbi:MAG: ubiquitin-like protein Pup [candidate division NC10 bacterium]|nr:ubiquitin-like protein Pup [candidate division NC10 bacterium]